MGFDKLRNELGLFEKLTNEPDLYSTQIFSGSFDLDECRKYKLMKMIGDVGPGRRRVNL